MRRVKRLCVSCLCCRMKKSTVVIAALFILFLWGNYFFLYPFTYEDVSQKSKVQASKLPVIIKKMPRFHPRLNAIQNKQIDGIGVRIIKKEDKPSIKEKQTPSTHRVTHRIGNKNVDKPRTIEKKRYVKNIKDVTDVKKVEKLTMAVLVISCNRVSVKRCLDGIFKYKPNEVDIPVIVSQDCGDEDTANAIRSYGNKLTHIRQPDLGDVKNVPDGMRRWMGYYKISRHYKWALNEVFSRPNIDSVIIVEDDLDIAPDFFEYFLATRPLLDKDPTLFCISAWNDNGKSTAIDESAIDILYRTDFFPGLGWLITRKIWQEFSPKWPLGFWDDWVRAPEQRKERSCIRPEISRTRTFGRVGVSLGQFFDQFLQFIKLNEEPYPFRDYDMSYLLKEKYDKRFLETVYNTPEQRMGDDGNGRDVESIRVTYNDNGQFERIAKEYDIMSDLKAGVPRTAYKGVVTVYKNKKRIYIAPVKN